jgi:hypothetical protein
MGSSALEQLGGEPRRVSSDNFSAGLRFVVPQTTGSDRGDHPAILKLLLIEVESDRYDSSLFRIAIIRSGIWSDGPSNQIEWRKLETAPSSARFT